MFVLSRCVANTILFLSAVRRRKPSLDSIDPKKRSEHAIQDGNVLEDNSAVGHPEKKHHTENFVDASRDATSDFYREPSGK